jgi:hypothetical protein
MRNQIYILFLILFAFASCGKKSTIANVNIKAGKLTSSYQLVAKDSKRFRLDSVTAPKPIYIQLINDSLGGTILTFLNEYSRRIYYYDYKNTSLIQSIKYDGGAETSIRKASGYFVKNSDSIYVYDMAGVAIFLVDGSGYIKKKMTLHDTDKNWPFNYPQYVLSAANPIFEYNGKLILTGQYIPSMPSKKIDDFHFTCYLDMRSNEVEYRYTYPKELYGNDANWEGGVLTTIYPELLNDGTIIHSYPVSHNIYRSDIRTGEFKAIYAGSNIAGTIQSINNDDLKNTPKEQIFSHYLGSDVYTAVKYDPYRKVFYRFLLKGVVGATFKTPQENKPVIITVWDKNFNYLGETQIGTGREWNWKNSFVTKEGLNIEYTAEGIGEDYLTFRIFALEKLFNKIPR